MTDKNEVLELEKFGAVVDYRGYYAAFPTKKSLDAFAAALEEKHQAQIAMLVEAWKSNDHHEMCVAVAAQQEDTDAFLAEVRAKAIRQFIKDFSFENAINSYRCSYCLDADSDAPLPLLDAIGGLGMPIDNAITEIELLADWIGGEMLYAAELCNSAAKPEGKEQAE